MAAVLTTGLHPGPMTGPPTPKRSPQLESAIEKPMAAAGWPAPD